MKTDRGHILIIGCGIGGVTAAVALRQRGFQVSVYEKTADFREIGAGVTLSPSAMLAMDSLGLGGVIREQGDQMVGGAFLHYRTGELLRSGDYAEDSRAGSTASVARQIHRADLHRLLLETAREAGAAIHGGRELIALEQDSDGVTARFADGDMVRGDVLIGCDGLRSEVRRILFGREQPRFTGQAAWRCLIPMDRVAHLMRGRSAAVYAGPGAIFVRYGVRHGTVCNCVALVRTDSWTEEGWSIPSSPAELLDQLSGWHPDVTGIIAQAPETAVHKWALFDRDPLSVWTDRRVTLLGDAAHPMLPFLGLGAAMAIEDAIVLGRACDMAGSLDDALRVYEGARAARTAAILIASRQHGQLLQGDAPERMLTRDEARPNNDFLTYDPRIAPLPVPAAPAQAHG
jgi:salicylate hydroxylase